MSASPPCRYCGKALRPVMNSPAWADRPDTREAAEALAAQHRGAKIKAPTVKDWANWSVTWPSGHYGYGGNDKFCTLTCGFRWAVRHAK